MIEKKSNIATHRFLDEAGDTTIYGKGKKDVIGQMSMAQSVRAIFQCFSFNKTKALYFNLASRYVIFK